MRPQQLYRLFDADGELLYIGISYSAIARYAQHKATKPWIGDVCTVTIETHDVSRAEIEAIERQAIIDERPKHNVVHSSTRPGADLRRDRVPEFCAAEMAATPAWFEIASLVDKFIHDHGHRHPELTNERIGSWLDGMARSLFLADCCSQCGHLNYPYWVKRTGPNWVQARYACYGCWHHTWECGWSA